MESALKARSISTHPLIIDQKRTVTEQLKRKFTDKKGRWSGNKKH
jgi:hypothetical protein